MAELSKIQKKIKKTKDLSSVVRTMKSIAAVNIRHYEKAVRSVREYFHSIELGFQILVHNHPEILSIEQREAKVKIIGTIVIGSERGMCGEFNDRLHHYFTRILQEQQKEMPQVHVLSIGEHITYRLEDKFQVKSFAFPSSFEGVGELLWSLLEVIADWREVYQIEEIRLFYNRMVSGSAYEPAMLQVLPLDLRWLFELKQRKWESRTIPTFSIPWEELFAELVQEYIYISLYRGFAESLASENASRLRAMHAAQQNIEDHLKELEKGYHQQRQNSITEELFDILSGFELLRD
ncbi:MAG: F0F1 ATP synthase subunit gamma [Simkaniaceae bacterium]